MQLANGLSWWDTFTMVKREISQTWADLVPITPSRSWSNPPWPLFHLGVSSPASTRTCASESSQKSSYRKADRNFYFRIRTKPLTVAYLAQRLLPDSRNLSIWMGLELITISFLCCFPKRVLGSQGETIDVMSHWAPNVSFLPSLLS